MKDKDHRWGKLTTSFTQSHSILWQKNIFKKKLVHTLLSLLASPRQPIKSKLKKRRSRILLQQRSFLAIKATDTSAVGDYEHWEHYGTFVRIIWEPLRLFEDYVGTDSFPSESYLQCFFWRLHKNMCSLFKLFKKGAECDMKIAYNLYDRCFESYKWTRENIKAYMKAKLSMQFCLCVQPILQHLF